MRIIEVINSIPSLLLTILIMMILGNNLFALLVALSVTAWCNTARQVRGMIKQLRETEYVYAAEVLGAKPLRIILKHYVPNMLGILILDRRRQSRCLFLRRQVLASSASASGTVDQPWCPDFDGTARNMDFYPSQLLFPCLVLCIIVMAFNLLGDGLRDALDPRLRQ